MEVCLNGMPIKMLVDSGSNVTIVTAEVKFLIKLNLKVTSWHCQQRS